MTEKLIKCLDRLSELLEHIMALVVMLVVIGSILALWEPFCDFWMHRTDIQALTGFLERVLGIVIGIELFKVLCRPRVEAVLEVMMFCIVRHMIVHETSAVENLVTVIGVAVIVITKHYFLASDGVHFVKREGRERTEVEEDI